MLADRGKVTPPSKKKQAQQSYSALPKAARQSQLASTGVLKPDYAKAAKALHAQRQQQTAKQVAAAARAVAKTTERTVGKGNTAVKHPKKGGGPLGTISPVTAIADAGKAGSHLLPVEGAVANLPVTLGTAAVHHFTGADLNVGKKVLKNAPLDAAEMATTTPASIYRLGEIAYKNPKKLPGTIVQPYTDLAKHPAKIPGFIESHPVSAALMVQPGVRAPGRIAGYGLRLAGKQTLERADATLPTTALRQARTKSRDAVRNAVQTRKDAKTPALVIGPKEIGRRVDDFYDASKHQMARVRDAAARKAKQQNMAPDAAEAHIKGAREGAKKARKQQFVREFGATWKLDKKTGAVLKVKNGTEGTLHDTRAAAQHIADKLEKSGVPYKPKVVVAGSKFGVVPEEAWARFQHHNRVGSSPATEAVLMRESRKLFGKAVLPLSRNFLAGQGAEGIARSLITGSGPSSYLRGRLVLKRLEQDDPKAARALRDRTVGTPPERFFGKGGFGGGQSAHALDYLGQKKTLADAFARTDLAKPARVLTKVGKAPIVKQVRGGYDRYTNLVFRHVNSALERNVQTAMLGKAIKQSPLMERHVIGLTTKAVQEAADGLQNTHAQAAAARELDAMYGKYKAFSPHMRSRLMHTTPFAPWYINTAKLILKTLPRDHPVAAALVASIDDATEEWRKAHHLSLRDPNHVPDFLLAGPLGRWLPAAPSSPTKAVAGLAFPQFAPVWQAGLGVDFTGKKAKGNGLENFLLNTGEEFVPGARQIDTASGIGDRYVRHKKDAKSVLDSKSLGQAAKDLGKQFDVRPKTAKAPTGGGGVTIAKGPVPAHNDNLPGLPHHLGPLPKLPKLPNLSGHR